MKLVLDETEVKKLLLDAMEKQFPGAFNAVDIDVGYGTLRKVEFYMQKMEPMGGIA